MTSFFIGSIYPSLLIHSIELSLESLLSSLELPTCFKSISLSIDSLCNCFSIWFSWASIGPYFGSLYRPRSILLPRTIGDSFSAMTSSLPSLLTYWGWGFCQLWMDSMYCLSWISFSDESNDCARSKLFSLSLLESLSFISSNLLIMLSLPWRSLA